MAAPTGAGKTGVLELALARRLLAPPPGAPPAKALYLAPSRALCQERLADWRARFGPLGVSVAELTGDADADRVGAARLICATPEKLDAVTRGRGPRGAAAFVGDVGLVMIDEVHLLGDAPRGATLEAVVARLKTIGAAPRMGGTPLATARYVAVSATLPNAGDVGAWLGAAPRGVRVYGDEVRPVPLDVHVRAYPPTNTDFLFEKKLDDHLPAVLAAYASGRPALVFCASRKGAEATARALASRGPARRAGMPAGAVAALDAAAARVADRGLADALQGGVAFHHAGLDAGDRGAVEALFLGRGLPVLCTTSTLGEQGDGESGGGCGVIFSTDPPSLPHSNPTPFPPPSPPPSLPQPPASTCPPTWSSSKAPVAGPTSPGPPPASSSTRPPTSSRCWAARAAPSSTTAAWASS